MKLAITILALTSAAAGGAQSIAVPPCRVGQLQVSIEREGFAGMSHDGAEIHLRNKADHACLVSRLPKVRLFGTSDDQPKLHDLHLERSVPPGMHPGPVMTPLQLQPDQSASMQLRWVDGDVYDNTLCVDSERMRISFQNADVASLPLRAKLCGPAPGLPKFEQQWLQIGKP